MITYIYRKRSPLVFSIEKLFDALYADLKLSGLEMGRLELPFVSKGIVSVLRNAWFVGTRRRTGIIHVTGDVHYAAMFRPFSRTVITIHDCVILQRGIGFKRLVFWFLWFGLPLRLASVITVISEQTKIEVLKNAAIAPTKIRVIPNFVDPSFVFSPRSCQPGLPRILHVGTTPNKNLSRVIAALRDVPCVLVIVGQLTQAALGELSEGALQYENVAGVDDATMYRLYRGADIVSFPSTYEGFGMPILEGQAVGRPVLTSDLDPMRQIAGPGGALLVDPGSVQEIRRGFLAIIEDGSLRDRLISAGRVNCRRFTLASVAGQYREIYREMDRR
jgi:glycosyltransferase involved in cell wall biosynthesis